MLVDSYLDTSFLWKLYVKESYSAEALVWIKGFQGNIFVSALNDVELISSLYRLFPRAQAAAAHAVYSNDLAAGVFERVTVHESAFALAGTLAEKHGGALKLRSLDALQLAIALQSRAGFLATFDDRLSRAAALEGLALISLRP